MNALVVGAGAVGQVYAKYIHEAGARVTYLVRESHRERPSDGLPVVTRAGENYDAIFLCVSSTAMRRGEWLRELAQQTGDATIVTLQPGLTDFEFVAARVEAHRIVAGAIGFLAWDGGHWIPPLSRCGFSGPRAREIVKLLRRTKFPAAVEKSVPRSLAFGAAILDTHMAALERAGWSLRTLRRDRSLIDLADRASKEALAIAARYHDTKPPALLRPSLVRLLLLGVAPCVSPVNLEAFFASHYTKVGDQTRALIDSYVNLGGELGLPSAALAELRGGLPC